MVFCIARMAIANAVDAGDDETDAVAWALTVLLATIAGISYDAALYHARQAWAHHAGARLRIAAR
jgi:hypothetical protein